MNFKFFVNTGHCVQNKFLMSGCEEDSFNREEQENISTVYKKRVQRPRLYQVLLHNDDYTTKDFVVHILRTFFQKSVSEAQEIMLKIHNGGVGTCGIYTHEIAEAKTFKVTREAKKYGHPLLCTYEPE